MAKYFTLYDIIEDPNTSFLVLSDKWEYVQVELGRDGAIEVPVFRLSYAYVTTILNDMRQTYPNARRHTTYRAKDGQCGFILVLGDNTPHTPHRGPPLPYKYDLEFPLPRAESRLTP